MTETRATLFVLPTMKIPEDELPPPSSTQPVVTRTLVNGLTQKMLMTIVSGFTVGFALGTWIFG